MDEPTPAAKLKLAKGFVTHAPPAQTQKVVDDLRTLVGASVLTSDKEAALLAQANKEKFAAVDVGGTQVLLTPHGELPSGEFLDPASGCALVVDHKALTAHKSGTPLSEQQLASAQGAASVRDSVDRAMQRYRSDFLPKGVVTTYGTSGAGTKVVCCVSAINAELTNYWAGQWCSEWILDIPGGGSVGTLTGKVRCAVHYFEDGNVQLDDKAVFQAELPASGDVGAAFASKVKGFEQGFLSKFEDIYTTLGETVLQGLRRRLPITKTKFDWEKATVAKLAGELQTQAGLR